MRRAARARTAGVTGADAAIAVLSASALAIGVIVTSLTTGMTTDVDSYMFGSILAVNESDVVISAVLCAAILLVFVLCYHRIFAVTFDESFARATGTKAGLCNLLIAVVVAVIIVLAMNLVGFPADLCTGDLPGTVRHADVQELSQRERRRKLPVLLLN